MCVYLSLSIYLSIYIYIYIRPVRPRVYYACFVRSRIATLCYIIRHV